MASNISDALDSMIRQYEYMVSLNRGDRAKVYFQVVSDLDYLRQHLPARPKRRTYYRKSKPKKN